MVQVTLNGNVYSDDGTGTRPLNDGGHRDYFFPLLEDLKVDVGRTVATVSSTSMTSAVGSKNLTMANTINLLPGMFIQLARASDPSSTWMNGQVTQRSGTNLWATMRHAFGAAGPHTDWQLQLSGPINPSSGGTVRSVALVASSAGLVVSGGPITGAGTISVALAGDAAALESLSSVGMVERTGDATWATTSFTTLAKSLMAATTVADMRTLLQIAAVNVQVFSTNGTWTRPTDGVTMVLVEAWAGGGGGGGGNGTAPSGGGGGGGGGHLFRWMRASDLTSTVAVTVGSGGPAGAASSAGTNGGNSSFGSYLTIYGGQAGGAASANSGGLGGGGGGALSVGSGSIGGDPAGGQRGIDVDGFGGGGGGADGDGDGGDSGFGGGGGGSPSGLNSHLPGGRSVYGGGGGASGGSTGVGVNSGGNSIFGGPGGLGGNSNSVGSPGTVPGGGGGGGGLSNNAGGAGAYGKVIVWAM